jgi:hypothetical protein
VIAAGSLIGNSRARAPAAPQTYSIPQPTRAAENNQPAIRYMARPERYCMPFIAALWVALLVVVVQATISDVAAVFSTWRIPPAHPMVRSRGSCSAASRSPPGRRAWGESS